MIEYKQVTVLQICLIERKMILIAKHGCYYDDE